MSDNDAGHSMEQKYEPTLSLSVVIDGATFSSQGSRSEVLRLYAEWKELAGLGNVVVGKGGGFNAPRVVSK